MGDYYNDTNYSERAAAYKKDRVQQIVGTFTGEKKFAVDIDYLTIEKLWNFVVEKRIENLLPLVMDLCNPSPTLGWDNTERESFKQRCNADYLSALAVIHHLVFIGGKPFSDLAKGFANLLKPGGMAVIEWVPIEDSQVKRMLAVRETIIQPYSFDIFMESFSRWFEVIEKYPIEDSLRELVVYRKKDNL